MTLVVRIIIIQQQTIIVTLMVVLLMMMMMLIMMFDKRSSVEAAKSAFFVGQLRRQYFLQQQQHKQQQQIHSFRSSSSSLIDDCKFSPFSRRPYCHLKKDPRRRRSIITTSAITSSSCSSSLQSTAFINSLPCLSTTTTTQFQQSSTQVAAAAAAAKVKKKKSNKTRKATALKNVATTTSIDELYNTQEETNNEWSPLLPASVVRDLKYMQLAVHYAKRGGGYTFPNPAVGCVLVRQSLEKQQKDDRDKDDNNNNNNNDCPMMMIIGQGFHPRAGYPHAEIFALLEAAGHISNGVEAAEAIVQQNDPNIQQHIKDLLQQYSQPNGPEQLFGNAFQKGSSSLSSSSLLDKNKKSHLITAYVTLEPCCHYGRTPPCAATLALAQVDRVVIGFRDPNPRVDGGGVQMLQNAGVQVDLISSLPFLPSFQSSKSLVTPPPDQVADNNDDDNTTTQAMVVEATKKMEQTCHDLVRNFVKRIVPHDKRDDYDSYMTGIHRMALRSRANQIKATGMMPQMSWKGQPLMIPNNDNNNNDNDDASTIMNNVIQQGLMDCPQWMEDLDHLLWEKELVLLRLNKAAKKKNITKRLGMEIAHILKAHVAQTQGHTVLLYRPTTSPIPCLDLDDLVWKYKNKK